MVLEHYSEFKEVLETYHVSDSAKTTLEDLTLVLLLGPTSSGRNTIMKHQIQTGNYTYIVSDTTRDPRSNDGVLETNGNEYWFRTEEEVLADLNAGQFLEAELIHDQQVSGISIRELEKVKSQNKIAITDVDLGGMHKIMMAKPDTIAVMVLPPSFEEWQRRLSGRGHMPAHEQKRRLETASKIFEDGLKHNYYHFVISDNIEQSAEIIDALVKGQSNPHQGRGPGLLQQMNEQLHQKLSILDLV